MASEEVSPEDKARTEQVADSVIGQLLAGQRMTLIDEDPPPQGPLPARPDRTAPTGAPDRHRPVHGAPGLGHPQAGRADQRVVCQPAGHLRQTPVQGPPLVTGRRLPARPAAVIHISQAGPWRLASRL